MTPRLTDVRSIKPFRLHKTRWRRRQWRRRQTQPHRIGPTSGHERGETLLQAIHERASEPRDMRLHVYAETQITVVSWSDQHPAIGNCVRLMGMRRCVRCERFWQRALPNCGMWIIEVMNYISRSTFRRHTQKIKLIIETVEFLKANWKIDYNF